MEQRLRLVQGSSARVDKRQAERVRLQVPGQIVWKDAKGKTQMAPVVTRDVSENGVSIECPASITLPLYRLVYFQVDKQARHRPDLPAALRRHTVLSAVFRVGPCSDLTGRPADYGLRMLIEPKPAAAVPQEPLWQVAAGECSRTA